MKTVLICMLLVALEFAVLALIASPRAFARWLRGLLRLPRPSKAAPRAHTRQEAH
jgi:hypothetical protein